MLQSMSNMTMENLCIIVKSKETDKMVAFFFYSRL